MAVEVRFDPAFVEEAVFLGLGRPTSAHTLRMAAAFHREREAVYGLAEASQRDAAFQQVARRAFQALGLVALFSERLSEFPRIVANVELIVVRRVWNSRDEQVELYVGRPAPGSPGAVEEARPALEVSTTLFIGLQAARCLDRGRLAAYLRHELMHVADMLDPAFAYDPHPALGGECEPDNELIRARFRVLWDLWVHERMRCRGWPTILDDDARQRVLLRAFQSLSPAGHEELLTAVSRQDRWTQGELLALARGAHTEAAA